MGPLASFITPCRASALGRPFAFENHSPTKWLPARLMKSYSSPLTFTPAKYASGAGFRHHEGYKFADRNPTYRILLDYSSDEASAAPSSPLRLFRQAMHQALYVGNHQRARSLSTIEHIFKLYTALLGQGSLEPFDTHAIARLLTLTDSKPLAIRNAISRYIDVFAGHYVTKALPPHSQASKDLLLLYKNMGNHERATWLWDWMVHQNDTYVSTKTYAEAIRLAAAGNKSLRVCEKLYEEALIRYSDELVSLILSPGFMLPSQTNNWKDVVFEQHLCLAIFYARICRGDWRTAYLNLDTAFRLWPSAIHCQFLKDLLKGRPVHEGYQVYSLFCQAGAYVGGQELQILLDSMARACEDTVDLLLKSELTKAMLEAVTVFVKIEHARLDTRHLNCLIRGFLSILPRRDLGSRQKDNKLDIAVSSFLSYLKEWFLKRGSKLSSGILVTVISKGKTLGDKSLFEWASNEFGNLDRPPDGVLQNSLLTAAGMFRSPETVKVAWESLARSLGRTRYGPRLSDWINFAAAASRTGLVPYYDLQLNLFLSKGKIGAHTARSADYVSRVRRNCPAYQAIHSENPDIHIAIEAFVQGARAILGDLSLATSKGRNNVSPNRFSIWCWPATVPEEWQRRLYDELSSKSGVDLSAVSVLYKRGKAPKSLGISYRELRYRSWKTINNLLLQAEAFEIRNERFIDSQHRSGDSHPIAGAQISKKQDGSSRPHHLPWLLAHLDDIEKESNKQYNEEEWREKILNLRSPSYRFPHPKKMS